MQIMSMRKNKEFTIIEEEEEVRQEKLRAGLLVVLLLSKLFQTLKSMHLFLLLEIFLLINLIKI